MRTIRNYYGWKQVVKVLDPEARFDGDKDIACVVGSDILDAEWDGEKGEIIMRNEIE